MSLPAPRLYDPSKDEALVSQFAQIHAECLENDDQMLTFLPPVDNAKLLNYWQERSEYAKKDSLAIIVQMAKAGDDEGEVAGIVYLAMPKSETGPFRSEVGKLMVSSRYRRMGIARRLMQKLEEVAREREKWVIVLDTAVGSPAEDMYPKLGYKRIGVIPKYGYSPVDRSMVDEVFFYKDLRDE